MERNSSSKSFLQGNPACLHSELTWPLCFQRCCWRLRPLPLARTGQPAARTFARRIKRLRNPAQVHGQQAIEPARVTEIQQALIREHYLTTEADGKWDAGTEAAMQKYQADQGWQTKLMPDSRALKKLGLGPDYSSAINAKTGAFADPPPVSSIPPVVAAGFVQGSGVNR
jgi:peptidoglycan hydrolase-like protein with peptidoglycan-binding domain